MKSLLKTSCASLALLIMAASPSWADINDIRASDSALEFDVGGTDLKYGETNSGTTLDTETGWMPSFDAGLTWLMPSNASIFSDTYLHLDGQATFGNTHYNGGLQNLQTGVVTPYSGTTNDQIYQINGKIGHFFAVDEGVAVTPYIDLGFRSWQRQLTGPGGYNESYTNGEAMGGLMLQVSPIPRLVLSASGAIGSTLGPEMNTQGTTYNLGSSTVWRADGKLGFALTPKFELTGDVQYSGFAYDQSQTLGGGFEPNSYTHQLTLLTGIAYHLQP